MNRIKSKSSANHFLFLILSILSILVNSFFASNSNSIISSLTAFDNLRDLRVRLVHGLFR